MTGGKASESSSSMHPSALRIRDNQRRSRARHKEYVEGLQRKLQEHERRGVEATMEMQQAARTVAVENARLRILLGYHGVNNDEIDKFLRSFPDQANQANQAQSEAARATVSQPSGAAQQNPSTAPKLPLQPLSRPTSAGPAKAEYAVPQVSESSTREVVDAVVGIRREVRTPKPLNPGAPSRALPMEPRQPLLQPRPQPPALPVLPDLIIGSSSRQRHNVDKLSVLATASAHQNNNNPHLQPLADILQAPSTPTAFPGPPALTSPSDTSRLHSASPRFRDLRITSTPGIPANAASPRDRNSDPAK